MLLMKTRPNYIYTSYYESSEISNQLMFTLQYLNGTQDLILNNTKGLSNGEIPDINSGEKTDILSRIYLAFPVGGVKGCFTTQEYYDKITIQTEPEWRFEYQKEAFVLYPRNTISLKPDQEVVFQLNAIVTRLIEFGMSFVYIKYVGIGEEIFSQNIPLFRKKPPLRINSFDASDNSCGGFGDTVTLSWSITGAETALITPGDTSAAASGTSEVQILDDTEYILYASTAADTVTRSVRIFMEEAQIIDFQADAREVGYGDKVSLSFELLNTRHAYINNGVGRVTVSPVEVLPLHYKTEYVIKCENKNGTVSKSLTVMVRDALELISVGFDRRKKDSTTYIYNAHWNILNMTAIKVTTSDGTVRCTDIIKNELEFEDAGAEALALTIECKGSKGQSMACRIPCSEDIS